MVGFDTSDVLKPSVENAIRELKALDNLLEKGELEIVQSGLKEVIYGLEMAAFEDISFQSDEYQFLDVRRRECDGA
jgi:hypothetical protein